MINRIHSAKSGLIFFFIFGLPVLIQLAFLIWVALYFSISSSPNLQLGSIIILLIPIITLVCMVGIFTWLWSIAIGLQDYISEELKVNTLPVKLAFWLPIAYILLFVLSFVPIFPEISLLGEVSFLLVVPAHLTSMACILYVLYFSAKTLKTSELQRNVEFSDFAGDFLLLWFFPIGVWPIQKRINTITN